MVRSRKGPGIFTGLDFNTNRGFVNQLNAEKRGQVIAALVEGNSIRVTVRLAGVAKNTFVKLPVEIGTACDQHQNRVLVTVGDTSQWLATAKLIMAFPVA